MRKFDLLVVGVGGQGVVLASDIIGEVALASGYDVKKADTLGMAQRGGSVVSQVRLGPGVWSPLVSEGEADVLVAFEKLEAARWSHYLRPGGVTIVNRQAILPLSVITGGERYPDDETIVAMLRKRAGRVCLVDGAERVRELGSARALNIFMLGCLSRFLPLRVSGWKEGISRRLPPRVLELNMAAFDRGRKDVRDACL